MKRESSKRINIVSLKMFKDQSVLYSPRKVTSPEDIINLLEQFLANKDREEFIVVCLDIKNQPSCINICSIGSLNSAIVHPREVFKTAILSNSASIIIAHNHPSGDPSPSPEDISITKRLKESGILLGIQLLDHIIIGQKNKYISLKEEHFL